MALRRCGVAVKRGGIVQSVVHLATLRVESGRVGSKIYAQFQ